ncbi:Tigger transposable element-derived protein 4 [Trichinella pseudospiralis]|uniref:Tigger transposable element-derived protein 4 n=1 Tax=Trichinella pseudospiralis TaxID=6337 RepID=A0A0V1DXQ6_TRIPS|nr:Tigger transposable element-derived protein 4 [Trichinella pseudospiralis]
MTSHNHAYVIDGPEHLHVVLMPHYSASHYTASALMLKRKALSVKEIVAVVNALNDGQKNASVCEQFELSQSTVSTIWKNRSALLDAHKNGVTSAKRQYQIRTPISGTILKIKAEQFATMIAKYNICSGRLCGKAKSSNTESVDASLNSVWPALRQQYNDEDIFNGDEIGVFYGLGPKRNLILFILDSVSNDFGTVSLLQPIRLLYDAWESVTPECMKNCFKKAKLTNDNDIVNDIHCAKQEDSDDSDADTTTVETTPLKTYPELIECVNHLERFIEATESADEGIFKAISVVRQVVKDHRPKLRQTTLKNLFQHK